MLWCLPKHTSKHPTFCVGFLYKRKFTSHTCHDPHASNQHVMKLMTLYLLQIHTAGLLLCLPRCVYFQCCLFIVHCKIMQRSKPNGWAVLLMYSSEPKGQVNPYFSIGMPHHFSLDQQSPFKSSILLIPVISKKIVWEPSMAEFP